MSDELREQTKLSRCDCARLPICISARLMTWIPWSGCSGWSTKEDANSLRG